MKTIYSSIFFFLLAFTQLHAQAENVLIKSVAVKTSSLQINIPGEISAKTWDNSYVRLVITVSAKETNTEMLKSLANAGRYDIQSEVKGDQTMIFLPNIIKALNLKGIILNEKFKIEVFMPQDMQLLQDSQEIFNPAM